MRADAFGDRCAFGRHAIEKGRGAMQQRVLDALADALRLEGRPVRIAARIRRG
jgi:hypothetical protein